MLDKQLHLHMHVYMQHADGRSRVAARRVCGEIVGRGAVWAATAPGGGPVLLAIWRQPKLVTDSLYTKPQLHEPRCTDEQSADARRSGAGRRQKDMSFEFRGAAQV